MTERIYTHRTRDGHKARIICTDVNNKRFPVAALVLEDGVEHYASYTEKLQVTHSSDESRWDLFERSPWEDVAVDTPIWVRNCEESDWIPRHFAMPAKSNQVFAWNDGGTSHTENAMSQWIYASLYKPEDY